MDAPGYHAPSLAHHWRRFDTLAESALTAALSGQFGHLGYRPLLGLLVVALWVYDGVPGLPYLRADRS
jgi:hypothetical protein